MLRAFGSLEAVEITFMKYLCRLTRHDGCQCRTKTRILKLVTIQCSGILTSRSEIYREVIGKLVSDTFLTPNHTIKLPFH